MRISYNAPVILTFSILTIAIFFISATAYPDLMATFFVVGPDFSLTDPLDYFRLFSHVMGHASLDHLLSNLMFILLLGPILEEKYGSGIILWIMVITTVFTGLITILFLSKGALGASGVVFAFIVLASIVNVKKGSIPLSFVLVFVLFIGWEFLQSFGEDNIAQAGHIAGGVIGAIFGFDLANPFGRPSGG